MAAPSKRACSGPGLARSSCCHRLPASHPDCRAVLIQIVALQAHAIRAGMLPTERVLEDRKRTLDERPRSRKVALGLKHEGKIVEARRRCGMLRPERVLTDRQ